MVIKRWKRKGFSKINNPHYLIRELGLWWIQIDLISYRCLLEQMRFVIVQQKGEGDDNWKRIKWRIALRPSVDENRPFVCIFLIRTQVGELHSRWQPMVEILHVTPKKLTISLSVMTISPFFFLNNLHIAAPIKITAMIVHIGLYFVHIFRFHVVTSILQATISKGSQTSLYTVSFSLAFFWAMSLAMFSETLLSVTCT